MNAKNFPTAPRLLPVALTTAAALFGALFLSYFTYKSLADVPAASPLGTLRWDANATEERVVRYAVYATQLGSAETNRYFVLSNFVGVLPLALSGTLKQGTNALWVTAQNDTGVESAPSAQLVVSYFAGRPNIPANLRLESNR